MSDFGARRKYYVFFSGKFNLIFIFIIADKNSALKLLTINNSLKEKKNWFGKLEIKTSSYMVLSARRATISYN